MKYHTRSYYTSRQKALMWRRWRSNRAPAAKSLRMLDVDHLADSTACRVPEEMVALDLQPSSRHHRRRIGMTGLLVIAWFSEMMPARPCVLRSKLFDGQQDLRGTSVRQVSRAA